MSKVKKPIPCRHYASSGTCFYGEQCQFMHVPMATASFQNEMVCVCVHVYELANVLIVFAYDLYLIHLACIQLLCSLSVLVSDSGVCMYVVCVTFDVASAATTQS